MSKKLLAAQICLLLAACSNPTDNSTSLNAGSDSDDTGDTDDTVTVIEDSDLVLPEQLSLVEPKSTGGNQAPAYLS